MEDSVVTREERFTTVNVVLLVRTVIVPHPFNTGVRQLQLIATLPIFVGLEVSIKCEGIAVPANSI